MKRTQRTQEILGTLRVRDGPRQGLGGATLLWSIFFYLLGRICLFQGWAPLFQIVVTPR